MANTIKYTLQLDAEVGSLTNKLKTVKDAIGSSLSIDTTTGPGKSITELEKIFDKLKTKIESPIKSEAGIDAVNKDVTKLQQEATKLLDTLKKLQNDTEDKKISILPENEQKQYNALTAALKKFNDAQSKKSEHSKEYANIVDTVIKKQKALDTATQKRNTTEAKLQSLEANRAKEEANLNTLKAQATTASSDDQEKYASAIAQSTRNITGYRSAIAETNTDLIKHNANVEQAANALTEAKTAKENADKAFRGQAIKESNLNYQALLDTAKSLGINIDDLNRRATNDNINVLTQRIEDQRTALLNLANDGFNQATLATESLGVSADTTTQKIEEERIAFQKENDALRDTQAIQNRIKYFFSYSNTIQLFKRAITQAFSAVKELDAAMTETAVVTDFSVGDMWDQMPEYTARAKALGVSITDAYNAATLYYQQGLKSNEVLGISAQTLKMARIASLEASDATDKMTAALRGFNMEITETSAERVADVYSELAAITASDVAEISTAMTKTASLASNAGMQFETTAAFLSQIIETTRESAETAGTALKTVIARFQELKKDPAEIGEVDGEIVDANKIEAALRTVGISLRDARGQFRDLDAVFLDLAQKWDTLDTNTQRYIATIAAGSRQQSRFIAMMSDYDRTLQLVNAANNAAGASTQQFEKTQDSLQSKLARLKDSWTEFELGIANSELIKGTVDTLNRLIELLNKLTNWLPGIGKSILKISVAFMGLRAGAKIFDIWMLNMKEMGPINGLFMAFKTTLKSTTTSLLALAKIRMPFSSWVSGSKALFQSYASGVISLEAYRNQAIALGGSLHLSEQAQYAYNGAVAQGIPALTAARVASRKEIQVKYEAIIANTALSDAERNEAITQLFQTNAAREYTGVTLRNIGLLFSQQKETRLLALENLGLAGANTKATTATKAFSAALYSMPLGWILAIIAAIIALITGLIKAMKQAANNVPTKKLEQLNETIANTEEALNKTKEALDQFKDDQNSFNELNKEFDALIKGTTEWKQKLVEVNGEVLKLIEKYPILAGYVSQGSNGQLIINESGWDAQLSKMNDLMQLQTSSLSIAQMQKSELNAQVRNDEYVDTYGNQLRVFLADSSQLRLNEGLAWWGRALIDVVTLGMYESVRGTALNYYRDTTGYNEDDFQKILNALASQGITATNNDNFEQELKNVVKELGLSTSGLDMFNKMVQKSTIEFDNLINVTNSDRLAKDLQTSTFVKNMLSTSSQLSSSDVYNQLSTVLKEQAAPLLAEASKIKDKDAIKAYAEISGTEEAQIKKKIESEELSIDTVKKVVITDKIQDQLLPKAKQINDILKTLQGNDILKLFSENGLDLTQNDLTSFQNTEDTIKKLQELGVSLEDLGLDANFLTEQLKNAELAFQKTKQNNSFLKINSTTGLTAGNAQALSENLVRLQSKTGQGNAIGTAWNAIFNELTNEEANRLSAALNSFDWSSLDKWDIFNDTINELNLNIDAGLHKSLQQVIYDTQKASLALHELNFSKFEATVTGLGQLLNSINAGETTRALDEDVYTNLIKANPQLTAQFTKSLDGSYVYLGDSINDLKSAIQNATSVLEANAQEQISERIRIGEALSDFDFSGDPKQLMWQIYSIFAQTNIDPTKIGFASQYNPNNYTDKTSQEFIDQMSKLVISLEDNKAELKQFTNVAHLIYETNSPGQNATSSQLYRNSSLTNKNMLGQAQQAATSIIIQADSSGVSKVLTDKYTKLNNQFKMAITTGDISNAEKLAKNLTKVETELSDIITKTRNNELFANFFSDLNEVVSVEDAINTLGNLGLDVAKNGAKWVSVIQSAAQGDYNSYLQIVKETFKQNGQARLQTIEEMNQFINSTAAQDFVKPLVGKLFGSTVQLVNGIEQEVYYILNEGLFNQQFESSTDATEEWISTYDWLYQLNKELNAELKQRNRLEQQYSRLLKQSTLDTTALEQASMAELNILKEQFNTEKNQIDQAKYELQILGEQNQEFAKYLKYNTQTGQLTVNGLQAQSDFKNDTTRGDAFNDYVGRVEELLSTISDSHDNIEDIADATEELATRGRDAYLDLEERVYDALVTSYETEIDEMERLNDTISDTNAELISAMSNNIQKLRNDRARESERQDLVDKRNRLAYLKMDTSGANRLEIQKLEKEIANESQSYTDSLIDDKLTELQNDNDMAAAQRTDQLQVMRDQLEALTSNGALWQEVHNIMDTAFKDNSGVLSNTSMGELLKNQDNWKAMSELQQQQWTETLSGDGAAAKLFKDSELATNTQHLATDINSWLGENIDYTWSNFASHFDGALATAQSENFQKDFLSGVVTNESFSGAVTSINCYLADIIKLVQPKSTTTPDLSTGGTDPDARMPANGARGGRDSWESTIIGKSYTATQDVSEYKKLATGEYKAIGKANVANFSKPVTIQEYDAQNQLVRTAERPDVWYSLLDLKPYQKYATGGLNTSTGPAWLDGTPSKPELVLNARDTANFLALRDILADSNPSKSGSLGDNYYDINIKVDKLENDYDVEQLANKLKSMITQDAMYRNVNVLNRTR